MKNSLLKKLLTFILPITMIPFVVIMFFYYMYLETVLEQDVIKSQKYILTHIIDDVEKLINDPLKLEHHLNHEHIDLAEISIFDKEMNLMSSNFHINNSKKLKENDTEKNLKVYLQEVLKSKNEKTLHDKRSSLLIKPMFENNKLVGYITSGYKSTVKQKMKVINQTFLYVFFLIIFTLFIMTSFIILFSLKLLYPLELLMDGIKNIASGNLSFNIKNVSDDELGVVVDVFNDMTQQRKVVEEELEEVLSEYKKAVDQSTIISQSDKNGIITYVNDAFVEVSGYSRDELIGSPHNIIRHPDNPSDIFKVLWETILNKQIWHGILKNRAKDGSTYYVDTTISPILATNGEIEKFIAIRHDITKVFEQEQIINRQLTDSLTGLPNRLKLLQDLEKEQHNALTIFNIDAFQELNKLYGHKVGDEILKSLAVYLSEALNKDQKQIYKLPGDVFAILCSDVCDEDTCTEIIMPLIQELSENLFQIGEHEIYLSMTAGVSYGNNSDILINANIALNNAKKLKLPFTFYNLTEEDEKSYDSSQKMIKTLKYAISNDLVIPYFQPIYNNEMLKIDKYEVLMRIINENGEVISPFFFLDIAHKVKIYPELTKVIIRKAFEMFHDKDITFTINISIEDIRNTLTQTYIMDALSRFNRPHNVVFEIIESEEIVDYDQIKAFVKEVKKYGVKIAIDDFGSGYSNFMHMLELDTDFIKIDGSIIKNILHDLNSQILTQTIVSMANKLNIKIIAEFVSSKEIHDAVMSLGIDHAQGYYFGEPKPILVEFDKKGEAVSYDR